MKLVNPVSHNLLLDLYSDVTHPEQKIKYLRSKAKLLPLMKGWYLVADEPYSKFHIANLLYGPSYVTGLSVLSYFGWISDRAYATNSCTIKRSKDIKTPIGLFKYTSAFKSTFHLGLRRWEASNGVNCIIASPTKALYDHLNFTPNLYFSGKKDLYTYLEEDLRFDISRLDQLDVNLLEALSVNGKKQRQIKLLLQLVKQHQ